MVAIRPFLIGGLSAEVNAKQGEAEGESVGKVMARIGDEGEGTGRETCANLDGDENQGCERETTSGPGRWRRRRAGDRDERGRGGFARGRAQSSLSMVAGLGRWTSAIRLLSRTFHYLTRGTWLYKIAGTKVGDSAFNYEETLPPHERAYGSPVFVCRACLVAEFRRCTRWDCAR